MGSRCRPRTGRTSSCHASGFRKTCRQARSTSTPSSSRSCIAGCSTTCSSSRPIRMRPREGHSSTPSRLPTRSAAAASTRTSPRARCAPRPRRTPRRSARWRCMATEPVPGLPGQHRPDPLLDGLASLATDPAHLARGRATRTQASSRWASRAARGLRACPREVQAEVSDQDARALPAAPARLRGVDARHDGAARGQRLLAGEARRRRRPDLRRRGTGQDVLPAGHALAGDALSRVRPGRPEEQAVDHAGRRHQLAAPSGCPPSPTCRGA